MTAALAADTAEHLVHEALLYGGWDDYLAATVPFVLQGLARGEPVLVAVPQPNIERICAGLGTHAGDVRFVDMSDAGRNPGRIIPGVLHAFVEEHDGRRVRIIGEPIWPGRSELEYPRCVQHEALINLALADRPATILCPYDRAGLPGAALSDAEWTHPVMVTRTRRWASPRYAEPHDVVEAFNRPLPEPPVAAATLLFTGVSLGQVRQFVAEHGQRAGLGRRQLADLQVAVNELATNAVTHAGGAGVLRIWAEDDIVVCEVTDEGYLTDRLAGRVPPPVDAESGRGLLLVNYLCDLVELYTSPGRTATRLHMRS